MCQGSWNLCLIYLKGSFSCVEDLSLGHKKELIQLSRSVLIVMRFILRESRRKSAQTPVLHMCWCLSRIPEPKTVIMTQKCIKPSRNVTDKLETINIV